MKSKNRKNIPKICVIGAGRWGRNHIKTLNNLGFLKGIVEQDNKVLAEFSNSYPDINVFTDIKIISVEWSTNRVLSGRFNHPDTRRSPLKISGRFRRPAKTDKIVKINIGYIIDLELCFPA